MELVHQLSKKSKICLLFKIVLLLILFIYIFYYFSNKDKISKYNEGSISLVGTIKNIEYDGNKLTLIVKSKENILVNYYTKENLNLKLGDKILINGTLNLPNQNRNFNLFNYRNYLFSKKVFYVLKTTNIEKISNNQNIFYSIKQKLIERLNSINNSNYLKAFILGDNSSIDDKILTSYRINGIGHLFAISGMHITILSSIILKVLNKFNKKTIINELMVIIFLLFYMFLVSFTVSIIRATLMFIIPIIFKLFKIKIRPIETFLITVIITLFINPFYIYSISFIFSYTVSLYLILFNKLINKYENYFLKLLITSFIAFLVSIPIQINNFYSVNFLSVIFNLVFVPVFSIIIFPLSLITFIFPSLMFILKFLTNIFENISLFLSNIMFLNFSFSHVPFVIYIFYYVIITLCLYFANKNYNYIYFILVIILFIHYNINCFKPYSTITMFDVGQGDSILLRLQNNKGNILVDTGGIVSYYNNNYSIASNTIIPYLKSIGIKKINYLILTHGDYDHMGEAINLVNNFKVDNVIFNNDSFNELETELIKVLESKNIKYCKGLIELDIGNDKLYFLNTKEYDNENDNSNVLYFKLNNYKFLFMGDAGTNREKEILEKYNLTDIDFIKIGHHGSNTSSSKYFIDGIKPKKCLISVGKNNRYDHPKDNVINILDDYCDIYRTDLNGSIEIKINKNNYKIKTYSP